MRWALTILVVVAALFVARSYLLPVVVNPFPENELRKLLSSELPRIFNHSQNVASTFAVEELAETTKKELKGRKEGPFFFLHPAHCVDEIAMVVARSTLDEIHGVGKILQDINKSRKQEPIRQRLVARTKASVAGLKLSEEIKNNLTLSPYIEKNIHFWLRDYVVPLCGLDGKRAFIETSGKEIELGIPSTLAKIFGGTSFRPTLVNRYKSGNRGGNLLPTPDGRLIVGSTITSSMEDYLRQKASIREVIKVDTSWYYFGHVDTTVAVIPTPKSKAGFVIAVADARLGKELLKNVASSDIKRELVCLLERLFVFRKVHPESFGKEDAVLGMKMFEGLGKAYRSLQGFTCEQGTKILNANEQAAYALDQMAARLAVKTGVPVIRLPAFYGTGPSGLVADLLPAVANMVVVGEDLIVPDPLLPTFVEHTQRALEEVGCRVHFLPSATFHNLRGQLHCATIEVRDAKRYIHKRYEKDSGTLNGKQNVGR